MHARFITRLRYHLLLIYVLSIQINIHSYEFVTHLMLLRNFRKPIFKSNGDCTIVDLATKTVFITHHFYVLIAFRILANSFNVIGAFVNLHFPYFVLFKKICMKRPVNLDTLHKFQRSNISYWQNWPCTITFSTANASFTFFDMNNKTYKKGILWITAKIKNDKYNNKLIYFHFLNQIWPSTSLLKCFTTIHLVMSKYYFTM